MAVSDYYQLIGSEPNVYPASWGRPIQVARRTWKLSEAPFIPKEDAEEGEEETDVVFISYDGTSWEVLDVDELPGSSSPESTKVIVSVPEGARIVVLRGQQEIVHKLIELVG
jgi:hypothetical protein